MKKSILYLLMIPMVLLSSCEKDGPNPPEKSKQLTYAAVNINDATDEADILVACSDGSYMLCDVNIDDKGGLVYFGAGAQAKIYDGIYIILDPTGTPVMMESGKHKFYFHNVTETGCDMAFENEQGEITYYWDMQIGEAEQALTARRAKESWGEAITSPFTTWWTDVKSFDWTWDDHQRKAIIPFLAKVTYFAFTAASVVEEGDVIGGIVTLYEEAAKSGLVSESLVKYTDAYGTFSTYKSGFEAFAGGFSEKKGFALSYIAAKVNAYADYELANLAEHKDIDWDLFNHPESHITLSRYKIDVPQSGGLGMVRVTAQPGWWCEAYSLPNWIAYTIDEENNVLQFHIPANENPQSREATLIFHPQAGEPVAKLLIRQSGYAFSLSESSLLFTGKTDNKAIYVYTNEEVRSWRVAEVPKWLKYETSKNTIWLETKSGYSKEQTGTVVVEATFTDGSTVTQSCAVRWTPSTTKWDNTNWNFNGTLINTTPGEPADAISTSMQLEVGSVASHSAHVTFGIYSGACYVSENAAHHLIGKFSVEGMTIKLDITRTGETTASCSMTVSGHGGSAVGGFEGTLR